MGARQHPSTAKAINAVTSRGLSVIQASERYGVTESTIYKALKAAGFAPPSQPRRPRK